MADGGLGAMAGFDIEPVEKAVTIEGEQTLDLPIPVLAIPTPGHSRGSYTFAIGEEELFVGDLLFQGSVGRTDLPGGEHGPAAQLRRRAHPALPAGRRRALRPRPGHVARPRAGAQPVPLAASGTTRSTAGERPARTQGHLRPAAGRGRGARRGGRRRGPRLHRLRLPPRRHPRVRGDGAVRARRRRGHRHRAQGDVHVPGQGRPVAHAAPGGHRAHLPPVRGARHAQAAAAGEALVLLPDVPLREAAGRPLPRALPDRRRGHRLGRPGGRRRGHRSCWPPSSTSSASRASPST